MKKIGFCLILVLGIGVAAYCGQMSKIQLVDGSVIEAEVVSLENGFYTIKNDNLGQIKLDASRVRGVTSSANNISNANSAVSQATGLKMKMQSNPEIMQIISSLLTDPQFQDLLNDPNIKSAMQSGNIQALLANPKLRAAVYNPKVQEIKQKLN